MRNPILTELGFSGMNTTIEFGSLKRKIKGKLRRQVIVTSNDLHHLRRGKVYG